MDHPFAVREPERARDVDAHADEHRLGEGAHHVEAVREPLGEVIHREIDRIALAAHREDVDDVRVAQLCGGRRFATKSLLERLVTSVLGLEDLERDRDVQFRVVRLVYPGESPGTDDRVDAILAQRLTEVALRQLGSLYRGETSG
jgi:hypothetical protein